MHPTVNRRNFLRQSALAGTALALAGDARSAPAPASWRSEEHTSELQSLRHLVCRLLLEAGHAGRDLPSFPTRRSSDLNFLRQSALAGTALALAGDARSAPAPASW